MPYSYEPGFYLETNNSNGISSNNFGFHIKVRDDGYNLAYPLSVDWELLIGKDALTSIPSIALSEPFSRGQLADLSDFEGPTRGTAVLTRDKRYNTIIFSQNSYKKWTNGLIPNSYDLEEIYGVRLSSPVGANIQSGNDLAYAKIRRDDSRALSVDFELANGGSSIAEGDEIELVVRSNMTADYHSKSSLFVEFYLGFNTAKDRSYASEEDFALTGKYSKRSGRYDGIAKIVVEPFEVPALNGTTFKLPSSAAPLKDGQEEHDERIWLGYSFKEKSPDGRYWITPGFSDYQIHETYLVDSLGSSTKGFVRSDLVVTSTWSDTVRINLEKTGSSSDSVIQAKQVTKGEHADGWVGSIVTGSSGDDIVRGLAGFDQLFGKAGDDLIHGGNGRDIIDGGSGSDELHGDFGWNTYKDQIDGSKDLIAIKSDQHLSNFWYGKAGNSPNGEKADFIEGLDATDEIKIIGVATKDLRFKDGVTAKGVSGIGIYAKGALEAVYTGGNLSLDQISQMTSGDASAAAMANQMWSYWGANTAPALLA